MQGIIILGLMTKKKKQKEGRKKTMLLRYFNKRKLAFLLKISLDRLQSYSKKCSMFLFSSK